MLDVYEASLDAKYLAHARTLADVILERFIDRERAASISPPTITRR